MDLIWIIGLSVLAAVGLAVLHTAFWTRYYASPNQGDQVHFAKTQDGWTLALHRYLPEQRRYREPVLLVPGIATNRTIFDLGENRSLARELRREGFDVWSLEVRGTGLSTRPSLFGPFDSTYDFDDYLLQDIPAALAKLREVTGERRLYWIGHSMGGLLGYAWLGLGQEREIAGLVTVAAPYRIAESRFLRSRRWVMWLLSRCRVVAIRPLARFFAPLTGWPHLLSRQIVCPEGIEGSMVRRSMVQMLESVPGALLRQFLRWIRSDTFCSRDGRVSYAQNLKQVEVPAFVLAADLDQVAPPAAVSPAYEALAAHDKQYRAFGIARGDDHDFGHGDILFGRFSREVIYPEITMWLKRRASGL